jgi:hypothetical protein
VTCVGVSSIVEVHQAQDDSGPLRIEVGTIGNDGLVSWIYSNEYDHGARPALALDAVTGKGVEVQDGDAGGLLLERAVDVY